MSFILAICLIMPCALFLSACGNNPPEDPTHTHNWATNWSKNETEHWLTCDGCDEKKDKGNHDGDVCSVCGYEKGLTPNPSVPTVSSVRDLEVITFDTGEGMFTLARLPDGKNMVIDSGTTGLKTQILIEDTFRYVYNIEKIDYFVLTNVHVLRTGQMAYILQNFNVINLFTPRVIRIEGQQYDDSYVLDCYLDALQYVPNSCNVVEVAENNCDIVQSFKDNSGNEYSYEIDFMLPVSTEICQNNTWHSDAMCDTTIVTSIEYQDKTILITGDVRQRNTQGYINNYDGEKDVDVLITSFEASDPYAITNAPSFAGKDYFECISLEAGDYAIITPISSDARCDVLKRTAAEICGWDKVYMITGVNNLDTAYVKINSSGQITVTAE
ncbi:MAG: hypothetical protein E7354_04550 [Clostridiales bacterium]|nr:hypothetical protein [Clostridiales bacterium]